MSQQEPQHESENEPERSSRILVLVMLALIILSIAAFLIIRPNPGNTSLPGSAQAATDTYLC